MYLQHQNNTNMPLGIFAFSEKEYEVRAIVALFYKASQAKKTLADEHVNQLELRLLELTKYQETNTLFCEIIVLKWTGILYNIIAAVAFFETPCKSNFSYSGKLPGPYIKRLKLMDQQAKIALLYIEV